MNRYPKIIAYPLQLLAGVALWAVITAVLAHTVLGTEQETFAEFWTFVLEADK